MLIAHILLPLPFDRCFSYSVPQAIALSLGDIVCVSFTGKERYGVVWELEEEVQKTSGDRELKPIQHRAVHIPAMKQEIRDFIDWVADYTLAPKGAVLKMCLCVPDALHAPAMQSVYRLAESVQANTAARERIVNLLTDGYARTTADIAHETGVTPATVKRFHEQGGLVKSEVTCEARQPCYHVKQKPVLSEMQQNAVDRLRVKQHAGFSVGLIDGVTGSGKTEVYFELIEELLLSQNTGQVLVLLPEIALSLQWLERFKARFGDVPHLWHSSVSPAQKRESWRSIATGKARVIVGARSALFLPYHDLRLIIVDEEHEPSYKQEQGVIYHARDMAVLRAKQENIPIILASATPSLETVVNAEQGRYEVVSLPSRHGQAALPDVSLIDLRISKPPKQQWLSEPLRQAMNEVLGQKQQGMLFLNRRGYAPLTLCNSCGYRFGCPHCSAWLVEHHYPPRLQCHHCDFRTPIPQHCPECGEAAEDCLVACGPGVERIVSEAEHCFPQARIAQMTSDVLATPAQIQWLMDQIAAGEVDIIIGTQMMAKGHHFPLLSLVGVVDGDMGLAGGDLRAAERCWQLLHQLAGRAGRGEIHGKVMVQTHFPDHPIMQALVHHDREGFLETEKSQRLAAKMPPYGKLAAMIVEGKHEEEVASFARKIAQSAPDRADIRCIGPAPAPLAMLRGKYRYRLLVKAERVTKLQQALREWLAQLNIPSSIRLKLDVDPYSFM